MTQTCLLETLVRQMPAPVDLMNDEDPVGVVEEVAAGIFFLKGGTHYFRDRATRGPAGSIRRLMCNNGWIVMGDAVLLVDANMPGRADALAGALRHTTDKPVRYLLNTHHYGDHIYDNRVIHDRTGALCDFLGAGYVIPQEANLFRPVAARAGRARLASDPARP